MRWQDRADQVRICREDVCCEVGASREGTRNRLSSISTAMSGCRAVPLARGEEAEYGQGCLAQAPSPAQLRPSGSPVVCGNFGVHPAGACSDAVGARVPCVRAGRVTLSCWHQSSETPPQRTQRLLYHICCQLLWTGSELYGGAEAAGTFMLVATSRLFGGPLRRLIVACVAGSLLECMPCQ